MTAAWGTPKRRNPHAARVVTPDEPERDLERLVARRALRATPGVPDDALDDFTGGPSSPFASTPSEGPR